MINRQYTRREDKQTLYFAVYVNVGNSSPQRAREIMAEVVNLTQQTEEEAERSQYIEKFFFFPVREESNTRMELLFPSPFLTKEQSVELHDKYYERLESIIKQLQ